MKVKTANLSGAALDWAVAKCEGRTVLHDPMKVDPHGFWIWEETPSGLGGILIEKSVYMKIGSKYSPSTDWSQGGPIIERESIAVAPSIMAENTWVANIRDVSKGWDSDEDTRQKGPAPLVAAMRCYITSKLGGRVEIPSALLGGSNG